jgi:glycosidase
MTVYDSWDKSYKNPFGAVTQNCPVSFALRPAGALGVSTAALRVTPDGGEALHIDLQRLDGDTPGRDLFYGVYALAKPGLYWYDFVLNTPGGERYVVKNGDGTGTVAERAGQAWQLTVYDAAFETPDWLKAGVIYQIMPDRFFRQGPVPEDLPAGRFLREEWGSVPEYRSDEDGKYFSNTYFGGNLNGIAAKLPYLKSLGVTALYLNPVFEAHSNHRYNTADYMKIDPMLGTESDFRSLCLQASKLGIRVILDAAFSHTGDDSRYFNRYGRYEDVGAYQSQSSPYYNWYDFRSWPDDYRCWWGFKSLPEVDELNASYLQFITGPGGVLEYWQKAGAAGYRLDVADELPSGFIAKLRETVKGEDSDAVIVGEVWEDASRKISYGERRPYLNGRELDGVTNYPFRTAILSFLRGADARALGTAVVTIVENYPKPCLDVLMNVLGTHDTPRILTELAGEPAAGRDRAWKAVQTLSAGERADGLRLVRLAAVLQYFLPGIPCVYYGDEAGAEGYDDPFNRGCYPWGKEDGELIAFYRRLGNVRALCPALRSGGFKALSSEGGLFVFRRAGADGALICAVNAGADEAPYELPEGYRVILGDDYQEPVTRILPHGFIVAGMGEWAAQIIKSED